MNIKLLLAALAAFYMTPALAGPVDDAMTKAGCMACHTMDKKVVGPSFKEIAAKYKGQDATAKLMDKVRKFADEPVKLTTPTRSSCTSGAPASGP